MNLNPFKSNAVTLERETTILDMSNDEVRIIGVVLLLLISGIIIWKLINWLKESVEIIDRV